KLTEETIGSIIQCLPASVVEFRGGELEKYVAFPIGDLDESTIEMLGSLTIRKIIFGDLLVPEVLLARVLKFFSYTHVQELEFDSCVFKGRGDWAEMADPVWARRFRNVTAAALMARQQALSSLSHWLGTLQDLAVTSSHVTGLPCDIGRELRALRSLDVAQNNLGDASLAPAFCKGAFPELQVLRLQRNNLTSYPGVCESMRLLRELQHLDLSQNKLTADPSSSCQRPAHLRIFNFSDKVLDVSCNHLHVVDVSLSSLKKLFLSQNGLQAIPSLKNCPMLDTLHLDNNSITELPWGEVKLLGHLQDVAMADNPYNCSCSGAGALPAPA
ncbi:Toll-like receptor 2, partial [Mesitornis unicolor]